MTRKKLSKKEETAQKDPIKKEEIQKIQSRKEDASQKKMAKKEGLIQKIISKKDEFIGRPSLKKEEKAVKLELTVEEEIIEKEFVNREEVKPDVSKEEKVIEKGFVRVEAEEKAPSKKEEKKVIAEKEVPQKEFAKEAAGGPKKKERVDVSKLLAGFAQLLGKIKVGLPKPPSRKEEKIEKAVEKEPVTQEKTAESKGVEVVLPKVIIEKEEAKEVPKEPVKQIGAEDMRKKCSEINRLWGDFTRSTERGLKELEMVKKEKCVDSAVKSESTEREFFNKFEERRNGVRAELDELHGILGKYEERVKYKDEAEGALQALEEVKVMLGEKLRNISRRIGRLRVRQRSDLAKLLVEAKECEEEVKRSEEDILDFEREYTKFLSMMGKISG
ncbi:hypothetical protein H0N98_04770 [Candidatus Micrarchaeota archaeon]|nr:hypothetical protein [Candidatus Micrarchaeota archaeon]